MKRIWEFITSMNSFLGGLVGAAITVVGMAYFNGPSYAPALVVSGFVSEDEGLNVVLSGDTSELRLPRMVVIFRDPKSPKGTSESSVNLTLDAIGEVGNGSSKRFADTEALQKICEVTVPCPDYSSILSVTFEAKQKNGRPVTAHELNILRS